MSSRDGLLEAYSAVSKFTGASQTTVTNVARGAAGYLGSYASNKIAGLETHFNWTDSDVGATLGKDFGQNFMGNMWGSTVSSSLSRLVGRGGKQDWGDMAADAFGNALASEIIKRATPTPTVTPAEEANESVAIVDESPAAPAADEASTTVREELTEGGTGGGEKALAAKQAVEINQRVVQPTTSDEIEEVLVVGTRSVSDIPNYRADPWGYYSYFLGRTRERVAPYSNNPIQRNNFISHDYARQYRQEQQPWFGLGVIASHKVGNGLEESRLGAVGFGLLDSDTDMITGKPINGLTLDEDLAVVYSGLAEGNLKIYEDQTTAYQIYQDGGVDALNALYEANVFGNRKDPYVHSIVAGYEAWDRAQAYRDVGDFDGFNREAKNSLIHLADYEQRVIIRRFTIMNLLWSIVLTVVIQILFAHRLNLHRVTLHIRRHLNICHFWIVRVLMYWEPEFHFRA